MLAVSLAAACSTSAPRGTAGATPEAGRSQTDVDNVMRKQGYTSATYRGERVYCRYEAVTGSNLESKVCLTAKQIDGQERAGRDILNGNRPAGCLPKNPCN